MFRESVEATDQARAAGADFNERCDQRTQIDFNVVNIFEAGPVQPSANSVRSARDIAQKKRVDGLWRLAGLYWCAFVGCVAMLPVLDPPDEQDFLEMVGTVLGGALVAFVSWRIKTWTTEELPRVMRTGPRRRGESEGV